MILPIFVLFTSEQRFLCVFFFSEMWFFPCNQKYMMRFPSMCVLFVEVHKVHIDVAIQNEFKKKTSSLKQQQKRIYIHTNATKTQRERARERERKIWWDFERKSVWENRVQRKHLHKSNARVLILNTLWRMIVKERERVRDKCELRAFCCSP